MMGPGLPANINPGIVNVPGRDPQAQAVAQSLLERDRETHHCFFNEQGFHNHLSHHLLAAYDLSAPAALLQAIYDSELRIQKPIDDSSEPEDVKVTPDNFTKYIAQAKYYHAFLTFFTEQVKEYGMAETIEKYVFSSAFNVEGTQMLARFMSGLYHPLIQTGYGVEFGSDAMVAQGLAQAAVHTPLVADLLDSTAPGTVEVGALKAPIEDEKKKGKPLLHVLRELYTSDALKPVPYDPDKSVAQIRADTQKDGRPEAIKQLCATWWGSGPSESQASNLDLKVEELFWANTLFLCGTGKRGRKPRLDFVLVHALNATLFLPSLLKVISEPSRVKLLEAYLPVTMMYVLARGRPRIDVGLVMSYTAAPRPPGQPPVTPKPNVGAVGDPNEAYNPWRNICASVIHTPDAHTVKAVRMLYYAAQHYGHEQPRDVPGCFVDEDRQKETLPGSAELDGTLFMRAAGVVMETLGWVSHGDDPGKWDFSGLGWDEAWKN